MSSFMILFFFFSRFIYPGIIAIVISSCTFPPGLGQFFAGEVCIIDNLKDENSCLVQFLGHVFTIKP